MKEKCRIVFMGTPSFAVASLNALAENGFDIVAVVTAPDKPTGRGLTLSQSDVKKRAIELGLTVMQPTSLKEQSFIDSLKALKPHLFVVVAFRMLPKVVWEIPPLGTFNLHSSLLPQYRGAAPINWAIINGESVTGVTTFLIDDEIDTGKILYREEVVIDPNDNAGKLHQKLMEAGATLVVKSVEAIIHNNIEPKPQTQYVSKGEELKSAPKIDKELCNIDWDKNAIEIDNLIRGLSPYPCAYTTMEREGSSTTVKIYESQPIFDNSTLLPGQLESDGKSYLKVGCREGALLINSLQMAGKRQLHIRDFLAGQREIFKFSFKKR